MKSLDSGRWTLDCAACLLVFFVATLSSCSASRSAVMTGTAEEPVFLAQAVTTDTVLSGRVAVTEDLLIPKGVTLSFLPGTEVTVVPSEGTRTDSQFVTTETEIVVHGSLLLDRASIGTQKSIRGSWGGIIAATPDARVTLKNSSVSDAQFGLMMLAGAAQVTGSHFENNETGIAAAPGASIIFDGNTYINNTTATAAWHTVHPLQSPTDTFIGNENDALALSVKPHDISYRPILPVLPDPPPVTREYLGQIALAEDTVWTGTVVIDGQIAVPPEVTLTIEPGTRVLFSFRDTNMDGLGESWIIAQGTVKVLGDEDAWVLFDSDDDTTEPGSWDSLSIIASDSDENIVSNAVFRRGVKAFHNHFSKVRLDNVVFEDNLRGIQFQESEGTVIDRALLQRNQSGARFRDSEVTLSNVVARDNVAGINFLRSKVNVSDLVITGSYAESFVSRESDTIMTRAFITGNVRGPRFKGEGESISVRESVISGNLTEGISFNSVTGTVRDCSLTVNGFTGLSVTDAKVTAYRNRIAGNGRYEIDNNGGTVVDARDNSWGTGSLPEPESIYDGNDEAGIGMVLVSDPIQFSILFPGMLPPGGKLGGELIIVGDVISPPELNIQLLPGTSVLFSDVPHDSLFDLSSDHPSFPSSEWHILGKLKASGTRNDPITFSPVHRTMFELDTDSGPGRAQFGSINLTGGEGGIFENCYIFRAATGIHARDCKEVIVKDSVFTSNLVGFRFSRSFVEVTNSVFELNNTGMRFHENGGLVSGNLFDSNSTGIFVTDNPENVTITGNTFRDSSDYHIKLGIHVTEDVEIEGGRFELEKDQTVGDMVFDREDDSDLGRVIFLP